MPGEMTIKSSYGVGGGLALCAALVFACGCQKQAGPGSVSGSAKREGGVVVLSVNGVEQSWRLKEGVYGFVSRENTPDRFEMAGESIVLSAGVPCGEITSAAAKGDFSKMLGATLPLDKSNRAWRRKRVLIHSAAARVPMRFGKHRL